MPTVKVALLGAGNKLDQSQLPSGVLDATAIPLGHPENPVQSVNAPRPLLPVVFWQIPYNGPDPVNALPQDVILPLGA